MITYINSPIKINLSLRVGARRPDGYHDIRSVFWRLPSPELVVIDDASPRDDVSCVGARIDGENIVSRAIRMLRDDSASMPRGLSVTIHKHLTQGGGVGAGSGNAACVLEWYRYRTGRDAMETARRLGADVSFLASGYELADASGRGDDLVKIDGSLHLAAVILSARWSTSTAEAYAAIDAMRETSWDAAGYDGAGDEGRSVLEALRAGECAGQLPNDFIEAQGAGIEPCGMLFDAAQDVGAAAWGLCGSGSSCFCLFRPDADDRISALFKKISDGPLSGAFRCAFVSRPSL